MSAGHETVMVDALWGLGVWYGQRLIVAILSCEIAMVRNHYVSGLTALLITSTECWVWAMRRRLRLHHWYEMHLLGD
jgi:hypothetical protein